jgi:hypothetical protein
MAQQGFRKDQRAKQARAIINKTIPQILASDTRARKGIEQACTFGPDSGSSPSGSKKSSKAQHQRGQSKANRANDTAISTGNTSAEAASNTPQVTIRIKIADTLMAARELHHGSRSKKNVAILNMASPLRPGGGVLNGATSQEESLCSRSTLLPSLKEEWYRLPEIGGIWSPDVLVFRLPGRNGDEDLARSDRFYVDVVSSAMIRFPDVVEKPADHGDSNEQSEDEVSITAERSYASQKDRDLALEKMRAVINMLVTQKTERVVLGAWGCGAYGNPTSEICAAWKRAIFGSKSKTTDLGNLKEIVFAVKDPRMAHDFARYLGEGTTVEQAERCERTLEIDTHDEHVAELAQKIEALGLQIAEARTPMLKRGLEGTLQTLKQELVKADRGGSEEDEDAED